MFYKEKAREGSDKTITLQFVIMSGANDFFFSVSAVISSGLHSWCHPWVGTMIKKAAIHCYRVTLHPQNFVARGEINKKTATTLHLRSGDEQNSPTQLNSLGDLGAKHLP